VPVTEYSPKKVKQSVTGNGNAGKEQVWKMLQQLLELNEEPEHFDATDALAVAVCHHFQTGTRLLNKNRPVNGWSEFIRNNPDKVVKKITG